MKALRISRKTLSASVIIPVYNAEKTIAVCLLALHEQTFSPTEIIVVDDGSKDDSQKIISQFKHVKIISQTNQGPAKARNAGARLARGHIIVFLDSDCVPEKNWLEEMLKPFANEKVVGVQGAYKTRQNSLVARFDQLDIEYRYERMRRAPKLDWIGSYSAAYRRDIFLKEKGFDETFPKASGEDAELSYRLAEKGYKLVFAPNAIVYHTHPETLWKYLKVKFYRAYWRMRMYVKHPRKALQDSYTPQELKMGIPLGIVLGLISAFFIIYTASLGIVVAHTNIGGALVLVSGVMLGLFLGGMSILIVSPALLRQLQGKSWWLKISTPFILCLRALAFGMGMFFGLIDRRVRA